MASDCLEIPPDRAVRKSHWMNMPLDSVYSTSEWVDKPPFREIGRKISG